MGQVVGEILPLAVALTVIPIPVIAVILVLLSDRAGPNGSAFLLGWMVGVALAMGILIAVASTQDLSAGGEPSTTTSWIKVILGVLLLLLAIRQWRKRPAPGAEMEMPGWMRRIDSMTPGRAFGFAVLLAALNPKNLLLIAGGAVAIAQANLGSSEKVISVAVFTLVASISIAIPVIAYLVLGEKIRPGLDRAKAWLSVNNTSVMAVLLLVIGVVLFGRGLEGLT